MGAPAAKVQVITCPLGMHSGGSGPGIRPGPRVSTSTSSTVVAALATVTARVYSITSPVDTGAPLPTSTVLFTVITGSTGFSVVHVPQMPLPGTTLLPTEVSASASTVAV